MNGDLNERSKQYQRSYYASKKKKEFYASKQAIALNLLNTKKIVVSYRVRHSDDGFKYFIGYLHDDDVIRPFCIILPQMSGYIKYFDNGGKNMSFEIENESVYLKYTEIGNEIKNLLNVKFHSQPIYDDKYIKPKVKTFNSMISTRFSGNEVPKERNHYICIVTICIDSVLRADEKNIFKFT